MLENKNSDTLQVDTIIGSRIFKKKKEKKEKRKKKESITEFLPQIAAPISFILFLFILFHVVYLTLIIVLPN